MIDLIKNETFQFKNYKRFREFLKEQDETKKVKKVQFGDWKLTEEGLAIKRKKKVKTYPLRDSGMKTLLKTFSMPLKFYYDKSPTDMLVRDVNRMRDEYTEDSEMLVHFQDKEVRAVSKPTLKVASYQNILDSAGFTKYAFGTASIDDYGLRITSMNDKSKIKVSKNDIVDVGTELMHSDTGFMPTSGSPFLLRLVCTNGLVLKEKSPLLNMFSMSFFSESATDQLLNRFSENIRTITADSKKIRDAFKAMKDNPLKSLKRGEEQIKKLRSAIGLEKFDEHERLTVKYIDEEVEKRIPNMDIGLYDLVDISTRMAKKYEYLPRRRIESVSGGFVLMAADELL